MKIFIALLFVLLCTHYSISQNTDWISKEIDLDKSNLSFGHHDINGNYYLMVHVGLNGLFDQFSATNSVGFIKLDGQLNIVDSFYFPKFSNIIYSILDTYVKGEHIYATYIEFDNQSYNKLKNLKLDTSFNIIHNKVLSGLDPIGNSIVQHSGIHKSNSIRSYIMNDPRPGKSIIEIDNDGNLISQQTIELDTSSTLFKNLGNHNITPTAIKYLHQINYYLIAITGTYDGRFLYHNTQTGKIDSIIKFSVQTTDEIGVIRYLQKHNNHIIGYGSSNQSLGNQSRETIVKLDSVGRFINYNRLNKHNQDNSDGFIMTGFTSRNPIALGDSVIYMLSNEIRIKSPTERDYVIVRKLDNNDNILWAKSFHLNTRQDNFWITTVKIIATSDGGCLASFLTHWVGENPGQHHRIFLLKLDANGSALAQTSFDLPAAQHQCYPNPGQNMFYLNLGEKFENTSVEVSLHNASGQKVHAQHLQNPAEAVNTENLAVGLYFYQVTTKLGNPIANGKWVKE